MQLNTWKSSLPAVVFLSLVGCMNPCGNTLLCEATSPNRDKRAVVFERDCGATTGFSDHVTILAARQHLPNEGGNAFIVDDGHGSVPRRGVEVQWQSSDRLVISYPASARIFRQELRVNGVTVIYQSKP